MSLLVTTYSQCEVYDVEVLRTACQPLPNGSYCVLGACICLIDHVTHFKVKRQVPSTGSIICSSLCTYTTMTRDAAHTTLSAPSVPSTTHQ